MSVASVERQETVTTVAKVIEISAESPESFEDAIRRGVRKAAESVHGIKGAWVSQQQVKIEDGVVVGFRVDLKVTFVVD
jgi:flavin-binding protein dodecin